MVHENVFGFFDKSMLAKTYDFDVKTRKFPNSMEK